MLLLKLVLWLLGGGIVLALVAAGVTLLITARIEARYPPAGPFVAVSGGRLATIQAGPNPSTRGTVVLLHGASANAADPMAELGRRLASEGFRVIAFDRPGFGWSDRLTGGAMATPKAQADAIAEALTVLGTGPATIVGHSWAGALATALALDHPAVVAGLVLVAPAVMPLPDIGPIPWYYRLALTPSVTWLLSRTVATPVGLYYLPRVGQSVFKPQDAPADYLEASRAALVLRPGTMLANVQDLVGLPAALEAQSPRYAGITVPTTIVTGDRDGIVPAARHARPLAERIPGARLVVLPGIGHMVHSVATDAVVDAVIGLNEPAPAR
ncbi:alpha/beta fold hydrolase [Methylobacterium sp. J-068]|uniref:alpha/beta fold hydrolase n=1 Tax=Methylobacterium sp. J-068 TaxID=2836649 RepID=UPI001FBA630E|nr:alpha/beta hydrolase [Methylobacterium sp. J-068]MCJ2033564.1 alpha/beta hydrolase [Methylobacterium sp. J-068]